MKDISVSGSRQNRVPWRSHAALQGPINRPTHEIRAVPAQKLLRTAQPSSLGLKSDRLLVDPTPETTLLDIGAIRHDLSKLLGVSVDVLTPNALPDKFRATVLAEARLVCPAISNDLPIT